MAEKILIATNVQKTQQRLTAILLKNGHDGTSAEDGQEALEILEKEEIDVGLVSLDLPEVDGIEFLRRAGDISPTTKIILMAKKSTTESMIAAIRYQAHD